MDLNKKVSDDFIRQLAKSIFETYGKEKTEQIVKELQRLLCRL